VSQSSFANGGLHLGSADGGFEHDRIHKATGSGNTREFTYFVLGGTRFVYASAARLALIKVYLLFSNPNFQFIMQFVASMSASADVLALASAEFNVSGIAEGTTLTVKWRGKPVFIRHRSDTEIAKESEVDLSSLKDPQADADRAPDQKWSNF